MANQYTIQYCEDRLKDGGSTDYKGWLKYLIKEFKQTGECPEITEVGMSYDNVELWCGPDTKEIHISKVLYGGRAYIKDGVVYELRNDCILFKVECTEEEYRKYKKPMPYMVYTMG